MKKLLTLAFLPLTLLLLVGFVACGGDDDDAVDSGDDVEATATVADDGDDEGDDTGDDEGDAPQDADLETYFTALAEIVVGTDDELEAIADELNGDFATDEEYVAAVKDVFQRAGETAELGLIAVAELDPPDDAADAHDDYVANLQDALVLVADFTADIEDTSTSDEIEALNAEYDADVTEANGDTEDSCFVLQDIADANSIDVDLECDV